MAKLIDIEGVGEASAKKLQEAGIKNTDDLLEKGATPKGRKEIAEKKMKTLISRTLMAWLRT